MILVLLGENNRVGRLGIFKFFFVNLNKSIIRFEDIHTGILITKKFNVVFVAQNLQIIRSQNLLSI